MSEVVVVGRFTSRPGREGAAAELLEGLIAPTHGEDGCILYALHRGADDPSQFVFVERWASREALDAHLAGDLVSSALARADELFAASEIVVYDPVPGGDAAKGSLAGQAAG